MQKKSFVLYADSFAQIKMLTKEQAGDLLHCIFDYHIEGEYKSDDPVVSFAMAGLVAQFERDAEKYKKICEKRSEAGRAGAKQKLANAGKCKQTLHDSDNDSDNDSESDSASESENERSNTRSEGVKEHEVSDSKPDTEGAQVGSAAAWTSDKKLNQCIQSHLEKKSPAQRDLLSDWFMFRKSIKHPYKSKYGIDAFFKSLDKDYVNFDHVKATIEMSISNEWQGLFPDRIAGKFGKASSDKVWI